GRLARRRRVIAPEDVEARLITANDKKQAGERKKTRFVPHDPAPAKSEIRISKSDTNSKSEIPNPKRVHVWSIPFRISDLFRISDFEFRISLPTTTLTPPKHLKHVALHFFQLRVAQRGIDHLVLSAGFGATQTELVVTIFPDRALELETAATHQQQGDHVAKTDLARLRLAFQAREAINPHVVVEAGLRGGVGRRHAAAPKTDRFRRRPLPALGAVVAPQPALALLHQYRVVLLARLQFPAAHCASARVRLDLILRHHSRPSPTQDKLSHLNTIGAVAGPASRRVGEERLFRSQRA